VKPLHLKQASREFHGEGMAKTGEAPASHGNGFSDAMEKHGEGITPYTHDPPEKRLQVTFRVSDAAYTRLLQVAKLFHLQPAQYAKAVLYRDLGCYLEPLDRRRREHRER